MNAFPVSFRFIATALLSLVLIVIGVANLRARIQWTDPTDGVFWTESEGILTAEAIDPNSPGDQAGINLDDQLLSINDHTISNLGQYNDWIYQTKPGASAHYKLAGSDGIRSITIQLGSKDLFSAKDGIKILLAFLHLGVGIFVFFRCDWGPRTFHFYLLSLAAFVVWFFSYTPALRALDWWVYGLSASAFLLLPALFVHFCLRFPIDAIAERNGVFLLYIPVILLGVFHLLWITGHLAPFGLPLTARSSNILDRIELAFFFIGFIVEAAN
jgi:two-component system NtrC family sensor kinase